MSENIIEFPAAADPTELNIDADDMEALHAEAFIDLENRLCDCVSMAYIAAEQIQNLETDDRELVFAVVHTLEMLEKLKRDYYASYHNKKSGGVHTSNI
jgi:hypothetical protein